MVAEKSPKTSRQQKQNVSNGRSKAAKPVSLGKKKTIEEASQEEVAEKIHRKVTEVDDGGGGGGGGDDDVVRPRAKRPKDKAVARLGVSRLAEVRLPFANFYAFLQGDGDSAPATPPNGEAPREPGARERRGRSRHPFAVEVTVDVMAWGLFLVSLCTRTANLDQPRHVV